MKHPPLVSLVLAAAILLSLADPPPCDARRIFVPRQHKKLQDAIDAASAGDTVWVAAGTYRGPFVLKKRLVLFGDAGPESTFLDGGDTTRVLHIEGVSRTSVLGFTIQHGNAPGGSGIYCLRDTNLVIGTCVIRNNRQRGVAFWKCQTARLADAKILDNLGSGATVSESSVGLLDATFRGNRGPNGGGIAFTSSVLILGRSCVFEGNRAEGGTGGAVDADSSVLHFAQCEFRGNTSAVAGGAVASGASTDTRLQGSFFSNNRAATGGAFFGENTTFLVQNCIFVKNRATAAGAAVQSMGRRIAGINSVVISSTFYRNGVDDQGAAIFVQGSAPEISHNIFVVDSTAKNKSVLAAEGTPRYTCNLLHTLGGEMAPPSKDTLTGDPLFCDPEKGDFHVKDLSPAVLAPCGAIGALGKGCSAFRLVPSR